MTNVAMRTLDDVLSPSWSGVTDPGDLVQVLDKPGEVVDAIFAHYAHRGFEPSAEERVILLEL